jgi:hypothetical protein
MTDQPMPEPTPEPAPEPEEPEQPDQPAGGWVAPSADNPEPGAPG